METSPLTGVPIGYYTDWGSGTWMLVGLGVSLVIALVGAIVGLRVVVGDSAESGVGKDLIALVGGTVSIVLGGLIMWNIARHASGSTKVFFVLALIVVAVGIVAAWGASQGAVWMGRSEFSGSPWDSWGAPVVVAAVVAVGVFLGDGAARWFASEANLLSSSSIGSGLGAGAGAAFCIAVIVALIALGGGYFLRRIARG